MKLFAIKFMTAFAILFVSIISVAAQTSVFLYQGRLNDGGNPANGTYDMQFKLYDALAAGNQIGATQTNATVSVAAGIFAVTLDFGANAFPGAGRYLEISVRPAGSPNAYTLLTPRTQILTAPYSIRSSSAATADTAANATSAATATNALNLGGVAANQFVQTNDPRLSDSRSPLPNSANYIQNTTNPQAASNFNVSGSGAVGSLIAAGPLTVGGVVAPGNAPVGQGRMYFDSATNKFRISESGGSFINLVGAAGVSGSGTAGSIPFWSAGTTLGNSALAQFGTNIGIGTSIPAHRLAAVGGPCWTGDCWGGALELDNASAIGWRQNTSGVKFGIGRTENGLFFFRTNSPLGTTTNGPTYDFKMDNDGRVGIGNIGISTDVSSARLILFNSGNGYGLKHTTGTVTVGTYIGIFGGAPLGGWFGTDSNHPLHFFTAGSSPQMTINTNGNVSVGTTAANSNRLFVEGGVGQSAASYGLPKFMLLVRNNGNNPATIEKCVNTVTGSTTPPCGLLSFNQPGGAGPINIRFPFRVTDRFFSMTLINASPVPNSFSITGFDPADISGQTMSLISQSDEDFYLIVF